MQQTSVIASHRAFPHMILIAPASVRLPESVAWLASASFPESWVSLESLWSEASLVPDEPELPDEALVPDVAIDPDEPAPLVEPVPEDAEVSDVSAESVSLVPDELGPLASPPGPPESLDPPHPSATASPSKTDTVETFCKGDILDFMGRPPILVLVTSIESVCLGRGEQATTRYR